MGFDETPRFPDDIGYGSRGGPGFSTAILETDSGAEERVARWANARRRYDVSYALKSLEDLDTVMEFYLGRLGPANGFRFKDFMDFTSASDHRSTSIDDEDQNIGTGDGTETQFQLKKTYTSGGQTRTRNITKPVTGTVIVAVDGVAKTGGVDYTVDTTTGIITFGAAPAGATDITAGFQFDVPVRFAEVMDDLLDISRDAFEIGGVRSIQLVEIRDELALPEEFAYGGAADLSIAADTQISIATGRVLNVDATEANKHLLLPDATDLPEGGPYFYITGASGTNDFFLAIDVDTHLVTITDGDTVIVNLSTGGIWIAF